MELLRMLITLNFYNWVELDYHIVLIFMPYWYKFLQFGNKDFEKEETED